MSKSLFALSLMIVSGIAMGQVTQQGTPVVMYGWRAGANGFSSSGTTYEPIPIVAGANRLAWCAIAYATGTAHPTAVVAVQFRRSCSHISG